MKLLRAICTVLGDVIGILSIFVATYGFWLMGHGLEGLIP